VKLRLTHSIGLAFTAWRSTRKFIESIFGALLMAVIFAIFFGVLVHSTLAERFVSGLVAAAVGFVVVAGLAFLYHLVIYLRTRGHDKWIVQARVGENRVEFCLEPKSNLDNEPWSYRSSDVWRDPFMKCEVRRPDGHVEVCEPHPRTIDMCAAIPREPVYGVYEVHWYGSQSKRRFFREITRSFIKLDENSEGYVYGTDSPTTLGSSST